MIISEAFASSGATSAQGDFFMSLMPIILIFFVFYFLLLRPQQKRIKEHKSTLDTLVKGDKVVTGGGVIATVVQIENDNQIRVDFGKGHEVSVVRSTIQGKWEMPTPLDDDTPVLKEKKTPASKKTTSKAKTSTAKKAPAKKAATKKKTPAKKKATSKK